MRILKYHKYHKQLLKPLPDLIRNIIDDHDIQEMETIYELVFEHPDYKNENKDDTIGQIDRYVNEMREKGEILRTSSGSFVLYDTLKRMAAAK